MSAPKEIVLPRGPWEGGGRNMMVAGVVGNTAGSLLSYAVGAYGGRPLVARYGRYVLISAHDLALAVVTGKAQDGADSTVAAAGLRHVFDVVLGYTSVASPKPAPDIALLALEKLGVSAAATVIVGDSTHDLEMAQRAGIRSIAVTYGAQPEPLLRSAAPTWVAHSFAEVVRIARKLTTLGTP